MHQPATKTDNYCNNFKTIFRKLKMKAAAKSEIKIEHNKNIKRKLKSILRTIVICGHTVDEEDFEGQTALHLLAQYWGDDRVPDVSEVTTMDHAYYRPLDSSSALEIARFFLANEAEVDSRNFQGRTPLDFAVEYNNFKMVSILLKYGASANVKSADFTTPLHIARWAPMAKLLLENGAILDARDKYGWTPLHSAVDSNRLTVVSILLENGADVTSTDENLKTPLHLAKSRRMAELLLKNKAIVGARDNRLPSKNEAILDARDKYGRTPLHSAVDSDRLKVVSILLEYRASVRTADSDRRTPLHLARSQQMVEILLANRAFIDAPDRYRCTPLKSAIESDRLAVVPVLVRHGAHVSPDHRKTALHVTKSPRMAELLLANGAVVDAEDGRGCTPLHAASVRGLHEVVRVLVRFGANVDARNVQGETALHQVVKSSSAEGTRETIGVLVELGVNVNAVDNEGLTVIQRAIKCETEEMVLALFEHNVEVFPETTQSRDIRVFGNGEESTRIGRLIAASIKLKSAGLMCNRNNLMALAHNSGEDYFSATSKYSELRGIANKLKLDCEAEVEKLKNHMLTDNWSLRDFMLADNTICVFNRSFLDALRMIDYRKMYPTYENLLTNKFKELDLMVSAEESFSTLLNYGRASVWSLPKELVIKILVQLDSVDMKNLISCSNSIIQEICKNGTRKVR